MICASFCKTENIVNHFNKQPSKLLLLLLRWSVRALDGGPSKRQRLLVVGGKKRQIFTRTN